MQLTFHTCVPQSPVQSHRPSVQVIGGSTCSFDIESVDLIVVNMRDCKSSVRQTLLFSKSSFGCHDVSSLRQEATTGDQIEKESCGWKYLSSL